jgi:predicted enzyme related to lactoylglutathione lyase
VIENGEAMNDQDRYIPGVPCWVDTAQPDPEAANAFYSGLFGWKLDNVAPPEAPVKYFVAQLAGGTVAGIGSLPPGDPNGVRWDTYVWVDDADETTAKVRAAGGTVLREPYDVGDSGRTAILADPEGAVFCIWQGGTHRGADVVNEHGSVNFNDLQVRDPKAASAFYGAVFGWELLGIGDGTMWALPGYGDFLERRRPGMREQMAAMGAPPRFEDVVASLSRIPDDQPDTPAHWGVLFGANDADAVAARAAELGGTVLMAPFNAPWVRMTVISDPQGATFTASQFVAENRDL